MATLQDNISIQYNYLAGIYENIKSIVKMQI